jgi:hypothetical protein
VDDVLKYAAPTKNTPLREPSLQQNHLVVSCAFGTHIGNVYPAVPGHRNAFFSNNPAIETTVRDKGWNYIAVDDHPLSNDILISSLQSKWVKFLQFLADNSMFDDVEKITYHDHKFYVAAEHLHWILSNDMDHYDMLIRETPRLKESIADEIEDAVKQERYLRNMPQTLDFVRNLVDTGKVSERVRILNTGIIHFANLSACRHLADAVYEVCLRLQQPECQIIFAALSQMSPVRIKRVPWKQLDPLKKVP